MIKVCLTVIATRYSSRYRPICRQIVGPTRNPYFANISIHPVTMDEAYKQSLGQLD